MHSWEYQVMFVIFRNTFLLRNLICSYDDTHYYKNEIYFTQKYYLLSGCHYKSLWSSVYYTTVN